MATFNVRKDGSGTHTTIQAAIQAASAGDIVDIEAGTFDENVDLWKGVTLQGAGISSTIIIGATRSAITSKTFTWALASTTLNISAGNNTDQYEVGRIVTATGIPANARIVSKTSTSLTISAATTQAASTARSVVMALQNDASIRVRGGSGVIKNMKVVGFDNPNPATEYATIYFRNTGLGSSAANGWEVFNCEFEAAGEYAILTDFAAGVSNLDIHDCKITGKTFVGSNPASGNQFSVFNVPRQLVAIQSANTGTIKFQNNEIKGVTGGMTSGGVASFNTAVTVDPVNAIVSGNTINGTHGYGYALRCRGAGASISNNVNYSLPSNSNAGFLIGPTGAQFSGLDVGTNTSIVKGLVASSQASGVTSVTFEMNKDLVKENSKVSSDPVFSQESNWKLVNFVYKHTDSSRRLVSSFKSFGSSKKSKLKVNMKAGDNFELHKIIISKADKSFLVLKRDEISGASDFDFVLLNDGPV